MLKQIATLFIFVILIINANGEKQNGMFYILLWTQKGMHYHLKEEEGQLSFVRRNCSFQNCYMTTNREYFKDVRNFDVVVFDVVNLDILNIPPNRSESQLYTLFSVESAAFYPIPDKFNGFFNLTWTYVLKSDVVQTYLLIRNNVGEIVAPKIDTHWIPNQDMLPIDSSIVEKIQRKSIAAMWAISNCSPVARWSFVRGLKDELLKFGHRVDVYGKCGNKNVCQKSPGERPGVLNSCSSKLESDYYFYLAFENSFTEDYVSAKILHGLLHYSVPVVYGGANYNRFLPNGSYLDAKELGMVGLARVMNDIINDTQRYYDFFKWHNYYTVYDTGADDYRETVCAFCAYLNNNANRNKTQVYENITGWWNDAPLPVLFPHTPYSDNSTLPYEEKRELYEVTPSTVLSKIIDFFLDFN